MLKQKDEWAITRRYMTLETVAANYKDGTMDPAMAPRIKAVSTLLGLTF